MIVKFYCSNPDCRNYNKDLYEVTEVDMSHQSVYDEEIE